MYQIDRIIVVIKPTQTFVDWINQHGPADEEKISYDEVRTDCTSYLIPPFEDIVDAEQFMATIYQDIFENELEGWYLDASLWPTNRTYQVFKEWIDIEYHSMVYDLVMNEEEEELYPKETIQ